jgi:hypothetical protein
VSEFERKALEIADNRHLSKQEKTQLLAHLILEAQTEFDNRISEIDAEIASLGAKGPGFFRALAYALFFPRGLARHARNAHAKTARSRLIARKNRVKVEKRSVLLKLRRIKAGVKFFK